MADQPYTLPEEDPFNITPLFKQPRRRRSSLFNKWIIDQQSFSSTLKGIPDELDPEEVASASTEDSHQTDGTFLCPPLGCSPMANASAVTITSYDFVDDTDLPSPEFAAPSTPTHNRTSRFFSTPSSIRSLHLSFRSGSPRPSTPSPSIPAAPHTPTRPSFFPLVSRPGSTLRAHTRSSSLGTVSISTQASAPPRTPTSPKWRPSVLGHFASPAASQLSVPPSDTASTPSRPSMSSTNTHTSTTMTDITVPLSKISFSESTHCRSVSYSGGIHGLNTEEVSSAGSDAGASASLPNKKLKKPKSSRAPLSTTFRADANVPAEATLGGPHIAFSSSTKGGSIPRVSFSSLSSRHQKKKKLIVSGIGPNDTRRFEGVKRWCESFGEVSQIVRMTNGDLHVHFRSAEVADTVCRLRAKVNITGVGSVNLSWSAGNKR